MFPTPVENSYFNRHLYNCVFLRNNKSCRVIDILLAVTKIHARLEDELKGVKFNPPIGPVPAPEALDDMISDGDPDGSPARFFPVLGTDNIPRRIQAATELHSALVKITNELEANINELEAAYKR